MPIAVLIVGMLLLVTVYKGNTTEVFAQIETDIAGDSKSSGFFLWAGAILFLAAAGSILGLPKTGKLFIGLILAVFVIQQKGLWTQAETAVSSVAKPAAVNSVAVGASVDALDQSGGSGSTATASTAPAGGGTGGTAATATGLASSVASGLTAGASILQSVMGV